MTSFDVAVLFIGASLVVAAGCGGAASSTGTAPASVATVELPAPVDQEGKAAPAPPAASAEALIDPTPSAENGKVIKPESPPFVARFAAVFRTAASSAQPTFFGGDSIVLFKAPVTCDVAAIDQAGPPRLRVGLTWSAGQRSTFQQFVFKNGRSVKHMGSIEVLQAPTKKGDVGRILLDSIPEANVTGGEIDALVCE